MALLREHGLGIHRRTGRRAREANGRRIGSSFLFFVLYGSTPITKSRFQLGADFSSLIKLFIEIVKKAIFFFAETTMASLTQNWTLPKCIILE